MISNRAFRGGALSAIALSLGFAAAETEPNDRLETAEPITLGTPVTGTWHFGDQRDCYTLTLPSSGIVTVKLSDYPPDCAFQVGVLGFQKYASSSAGSVDSKPGQPLEFRFAARGEHPGTVSVRLSNAAAATSAGGLGFVKTARDGPWYHTPHGDKPDPAAPPATHDGIPVKPPITYRLSLAHQALDDAYEKAPDPGVRPADQLKLGLLKTLRPGEQITAYLFDERPAIIADPERGIAGPGGLNDEDTYHLTLGEPDTLRVVLTDLPPESNTQITVLHPGGWKASEVGASSFELEIGKPGDVFVQVGRGDTARPLAFSTTPYKLAVTAASQGHIVTTGDPVPGSPSSLKQKITTGAPTEVGGGEVAAGGGEVRIVKPGDPLDGLTITVPAGAYPGGSQFAVSHRPITGHEFGEHFMAISPLIEVRSGGAYSEGLMKIRIPCTVPDGHFAMPFYYDPATGKLDGVPVVAVAKDSVTALTRHFSLLVVCSITTAYLDTVGVDTGFRPGKDDWQFENLGTHPEPEGVCAGMCLTAMWHWEKRGQNDVSQRLWGLYDNDGREQAVPEIWQDDRLAQRLITVVQNELNWDTLQASIHSSIAESAPKLSWYSAGHAMLLTGQPQYISVRNPRYGIGHAVIAYKFHGGVMHVADPNFPGDLSENRRLRFEGNAFVPYYSAKNADAAKASGGVAFDVVRFCGRSAFIPWDTIGKRFGQMHADRESGVDTLGQRRRLFTSSHMTWVPEDDTAPQRLESGHVTASDHIEIGIQADPNRFTPMFKIYDYRSGEWLPAGDQPGGDRSGVVPLEHGINRLGVFIFYKHRLGRATVVRWNDFKWLDIYRLTIRVEPATQPVEIGGTARFKASFGGDAGAMPEFPRWEWQFGDGAKYASGPEPATTHRYTEAGEYEVIARLYHNVTNELIGDGRAKVTVKPGPGAPTAPGGVAVRISHNVGGRLATDRILSAGESDPSKPRTLLSDLTGAKMDKTYSFTATASGLAAGRTVDYEWTFYDAGAPVIQQTPQIPHRFVSAGTHKVRVRVLDRSTRDELARDEVQVTLKP